MGLNKDDIDTYLLQLTERVERLEKRMSIEDKFDKEVQEQLEITMDCLKKQREWNQTAQELFDLHEKYLKFFNMINILGGNND